MNKSAHPPLPSASGHAPKVPPLRLFYVESYWLSRRTVWYLMQDVGTYADNAEQAVALVQKARAGREPFDVIIVEHGQSQDGSGLRVVRALLEAGCKGTILAIGVDDITEIERQHYETFDTPYLRFTPGNHTDLKIAVHAASGRNTNAGGETTGMNLTRLRRNQSSEHRVAGSE